MENRTILIYNIKNFLAKELYHRCERNIHDLRDTLQRDGRVTWNVLGEVFGVHLVEVKAVAKSERC